MLDLGWSEMAVIALLALIVIGPKDLPRVLRTMGQFMRKARSLSREFQSGLDEVMREAELDEARKAIEKTRSGHLDREIRKAIDPSGEVDKELREIDRAARDDGKPRATMTKPAGSVGTMRGDEAEAGKVVRHPAGAAAEPVGSATADAAGAEAADTGASKTQQTG